MTGNYKALALGAGIAAALALSACGKRNNVTAPGAESAAPPAETAAPAASGTDGTMGAAPESGAPATSAPPAG